jgi:hypothetical protein
MALFFSLSHSVNVTPCLVNTEITNLSRNGTIDDLGDPFGRNIYLLDETCRDLVKDGGSLLIPHTGGNNLSVYRTTSGHSISVVRLAPFSRTENDKDGDSGGSPKTC